MKKLIIILIAFLLSFRTFAQTFEISGQIKDDETGATVPFCYVNVLNPTDSITVACITDDNGYFKVSLAPGQYKFAFNQLGYINDTTALLAISSAKFLDVFRIKPADAELGTVEIKGKSNQQYLDKEIQAVTTDMQKSSANSYDVLDKVKGLSYDRFNEKITVDNDDKVIIIVNGIEKDAEFIKNINPERLQKVEIIRSPSGKYALAGYKAVINLVLKDNYKGTDFSISNNAMINFTKYSKTILPVDYGNISANYTNNKLNIYGSYSEIYNRLKINSLRKHNYFDNTYMFYSADENNPENLNVGRFNNNFTAGADYFISPKHVLSYETKYVYSPLNLNFVNTDYIVTSDRAEFPESFKILNQTSTDSKTFDNSLFYSANFNDRNSLKMSYVFSVYDNRQNVYSETDGIGIMQNIYNTRDYSVLSVDYFHTFSDKFDLNAGYGNTFKGLKNSYVSDYYPTEQTFGYTDLRNQAYVYFSYKPGAKFSVKFGAAAENSIISAEDTRNTYNILLPHLDLNYAAGKNFNILLKYRASSVYPTIEQANPFETVVDWQNVTVGNPDLKPSSANTVSGVLTIMQGLITIEPYYTFSSNSIIQTISMRNVDNMWLTTYENAGEYTRIGFKPNITVPIAKKFFLQSSAEFYQEEISYMNESHKISDWVTATQFFYRDPKRNTVAGVMYRNQLRKFITWQGYEYNDNDFWAVMVQQPFFKNKLNVMVLYSLPLNWGVTYYQGNYVKTTQYEMTENTEIALLKNLIMFRISYRFSSGNTTKKVEKNINIEKAESERGLI